MLVLDTKQTEAFAWSCISSSVGAASKIDATLGPVLTDVIPKVPIKPINPPNGADVSALFVEGDSLSHIGDQNNHYPVIDFLKPKVASATTAPISIALVGEAHNVIRDKVRGSFLWNAFDKSGVGERLVLLERAMNRNSYYGGDMNKFGSLAVVTEETMFPRESQVHSNAQFGAREAMVAAYLVLCLANGRQDLKSRILVFFGEEHIKKICGAMEHFISHAPELSFLKKRSRAFFTIKSLK
jgi:hypothetical protein